MSRPFGLIVTDTSPLFTLVLAGDQIPDAAAAQGRNVARQRKSLDLGVVRDRLRTQLQRDRDTPTS